MAAFAMAVRSFPSTLSTSNRRTSATTTSLSFPSIVSSSLDVLRISFESKFISLSYEQAAQENLRRRKRNGRERVVVVVAVACSTSSNSKNTVFGSTKLFVSGLSFRTTEESLRNAFQSFGQLVEVNLVMDRIANRPRGFAFLRYATEEESKRAIEEMHGKFLDGRVIFVEVAKRRSELRDGSKQPPRRY